MLTVEGLNTYYGRAHILSDLALQATAGEVVVLLGRNGAGKSTTMKSVIGLVPAESGAISFDGARIDRLSPHRIARLGLGYVPEDRRIFTDLNVMENLEVGRQKPRDGAPTWTPERLFELFPNLGRMKDRPGGRMSGGEQQMLTIARSLMGNPRLILLDEPSEGLTGDRRADGPHDSSVEGGRSLRAAVGAEPAFRPDGGRSRLHHRKGPHPLFGHHGRTRRRCGGARTVSVGVR